MLGLAAHYGLVQPHGSASWWSGATKRPYVCTDCVAARFSCSNCSATGEVVYAATSCTHGGSPQDSRGKIMLADRGKCTFAHKALVAERAGAIGLLVANNEPLRPFFMATNPGENDSFSLPVVMVSQDYGRTIQSFMTTHNEAVRATVVVQERGHLAVAKPSNYSHFESLVHPVASATPSTRTGSVIAATFAGRQDRMSLTVRYIVRMLELGLIDSYHVWAYNRTIEDGVWIRQILPTVHPKIVVMEPKHFDLQSNYHFFDFYSYYNTSEHADTLVVKLDDDIVYIDISSFDEYLTFARRVVDDGSYFYVAPMIINNGVGAYYQQQHGLVPLEWMQLEYPNGNNIKGYCGDVWSNRTLGMDLHFLFLNDPAHFTGHSGMSCADDQKHGLGTSCHDNLSGRFSINFLAFAARDLAQLRGVSGDEAVRSGPLHRVMKNDEEELSVVVPERLDRQNVIFNDLVVVHLSSSQQEANTIISSSCFDTGIPAAPMNVSFLLERYTALADRILGPIGDIQQDTEVYVDGLSLP